ncbi:hypothetical protein C7N43_03125 [Sphingobacteriales bacterium UPWRP_1]|nr:hypothetical protein BVG80_08525 [Sphingobacteriales bacterium TSM_CSM]PSJ78472.1 hypothetical protein C7N43_03125 [Sphingobacteriales bacterium UPWRP_1]
MTTFPNTPKLVLENMLEVLEYERKRISLNLHDSVQNKLRLLRDEMHEPGQRQKVDAILDELRNIAYNLVPKSLQEFSLKEYLLIYTATLNKTYKGQFHVDYRSNVQIEVPKDIENELFNIVQECMTNISKYAESPLVLIRYNQLPDSLEFIVQDFGEGFDLQVALEKNSIGLKSIMARTQFIGGECNIKTLPDGGGARVKITIPIRESWREQEEKTIFDEDIENRLKTASAPSSEQIYEEDFEPKVFLLVDNQPEIAIGLISILTKEWSQATFLAATSVEEAFIFLEEMPVDILVTDISMPDKSGLNLLEYVKDKHPKVKKLIYSINDNPAYVYKAIHKLSVDGYIWKEDTPAAEDGHQLIEAVKQVIATNEAFYSRQIEETRSYLEPKTHDIREDKKHRDIFRQYALMIKEKSVSGLLEGKENWRKLLSKDVRDKLDEVADSSSIDRYFRLYKQSLGLNEDWEILQLIMQVANDFGLLDDKSETTL